MAYMRCLVFCFAEDDNDNGNDNDNDDDGKPAASLKAHAFTHQENASI